MARPRLQPSPLPRLTPFLFLQETVGAGLLVCTAWRRGPALTKPQLEAIAAIQARLARETRPVSCWATADTVTPLASRPTEPWLRRKLADHPAVEIGRDQVRLRRLARGR
jgi:hypothetical protein